MNRDPDRHRSWRATMMLSAVGITMALCIIIGAFIGIALDRWLGTNYLVIVFAVLGIVAAFVELFRAVARAARAEEEEDERRRRGRRPPSEPDGE